MHSHSVLLSKTHYHIRWVTSGELDWERHDTQIKAEEAAGRLGRPDEQFAIERFEETCVKCAMLVGTCHEMDDSNGYKLRSMPPRRTCP